VRLLRKTSSTLTKLRSNESRNLHESFDAKHNSLTLARFIFASLVVVSHSFPLGGYHANSDPWATWSKGQADLGGIAVEAFFLISGLLVAKSYDSVRGPGEFLFRRALRILPAFWLALIVGALVFGPIAWYHEHHSLGGYFSGSVVGPWHYIYSNVFVQIHQWNINGLFASTPFGQNAPVSAINGSLWTLIFEAKCYIMLAILGSLGLLRYRKLVVAITLFFFVMMVIHFVNPTLTVNIIPFFFPMAVSSFPFFFFMGVLFHLYGDAIPMNYRLGLAAWVVVAYTMFFGGWTVFGGLAFCYALLWTVLTFSAQWFERFGDPTYGTYVFAFPIQMMLADFGFSQLGRWNNNLYGAIYIAVSLMLSAAMGYASWHLLEKHALRLKKRWPQRAGQSVV
jgi:peptidoglycan/LPS O-acetylase OafA/YrhL